MEKEFANSGQIASTPSYSHDIENLGDYSHLNNSSVQNFAWENVTVTVKDGQTAKQKTIIADSSGIVKAGEMLAIMGPSGCGKTTLLNVLANRSVGKATTVSQSRLVNGSRISHSQFRQISCYVEQEEELLGALTVKETMYFAAELSLPRSISKSERIVRIDALISAFGLLKQADVLIGTPIRKGISGGQKRRVTVASQLITSPKIIFLDEPTSGLDSQAAFEVMSFVKNIAVKYQLIVITSIHQPSTNTYGLFSSLLLLSAGSTIYSGPIASVPSYFAAQGHPMPIQINPAEFILELVNTDFALDQRLAEKKLDNLRTAWFNSPHHTVEGFAIAEIKQKATVIALNESMRTWSDSALRIPYTLVHRNLIKSYRDIIAYGIRIAMYLGLAILMGTVWLRLAPTQGNIVAFTNALFYGGAFMSFMAVAYIPSYLEDRTLYLKERANGLYGPTAFMAANFAVGLPFLFFISLLFSILVYWLANFRPSGQGFFMFVLWLFLDLLAAESLVVLITNVAPIFVVALAAVAFANGLWMSVNGFMVQPATLNVFWRYVFHYIDYQAYVFQGMMVNEFGKRNYSCERLLDDSGCHCIYVTELQSQCLIKGQGVLDSYGYNPDKVGLWIGIMIVIIFVYRMLGWAVLYARKA